MEDDRIVKWSKAHKKRIVKEYLARYNYPVSDKPNAIFMAGVPGAGKTEFANRLVPQLSTPPLHIDMDEIAQHIENYKPKIAHLFRAGATIILERLYDQAVEKGIDILMDGTFSHPKAIQNIERAIKHGYSVRIYFISPDPITAWEKTKEREVVENRSININGFVEAYQNLLSNLTKVQATFGEKVPISIVLKNEDNRLMDIIENVQTIQQYTKPILTKSELRTKIKEYEETHSNDQS